MIEEQISFSIILNGDVQDPEDLPGHWRLIDYLHEKKGLTGTKFGCGAGYCKACTVCTTDASGVVRAIPACCTSLDVCNGWSITTVEGLGDEENLHPVQIAAIEADAFQCGYCTPGFLMEVYALLTNTSGDELDARAAGSCLEAVLEGHLCRCTGYQRYVRAFMPLISGDDSPPGVETLPVPVKENRLTADPKWELIRLLHEAAEVENALMLQYLYAAFSLRRPLYQSLAGFGHRTPRAPVSLIAIAIEEMMHLDTVNRFIVALGGRPNLTRQDYPWEPDIYPFEFSLEPLSRKSIAKYLYVEAPRDEIETDCRIADVVSSLLPPDQSINRVGSIYTRIQTEMCKAEQSYPALVDWTLWQQRISMVQEEGERDHYEFFRSLLLGEHPAMQFGVNPWSLSTADPRYPVAHHYMNPTAYAGQANSLPHGPVRRLAMLANRHYWLTMGLLELSYVSDGTFHPAARRHMAGPLLQLGWHLPETWGAPVPFDRFSMDFFAGSDRVGLIDWLLVLLTDIRSDEHALKAYLPAAYLEIARETIVELRACLSSDGHTASNTH